MWRASLVLVALAAGCGAEAPATVGDACRDFSECAARASAACIAAWPDGYCTELACQTGSCPSGSRCAQGLMFDGVPFESFCLTTCTSTPDCRDGYSCVDIAQAEDVCVPENPR